MQLHFNSTYIDVLPTDESYRYRSIMGEHTLTLYFALPSYTDIPTGAWCEFANERYTLNQPAKIVKHNTRHFEYTLTMDSEGVNLKNYKFRNPNDKTLKFPFTASPRYHIQILVDCLNMIDSGWQVGNCIEASEKLVSYNHNNCLEALEMIAKAFETEYEIIGKTIHLHKVEYFKNNPLPLQYGKGKGFKTGVSRTTEQSRITRLYAQGGERNIDRSKYGNKELLLPKSQEYTYEGVTFVSDDKGLSIAIKNAQNNGFVNEQSLDLSHIYPKRKGTITEVFEVDHDKHFYDFTDTSIPQALDFNAMQIKGEKMLIYFQSGMLSGREFEVQKYDHNQKRFQLVPKEEDGVTMPNDIFKPAIGDEYSVYNMQMPNAYICDDNTKTGASWEMMKEACKYLYENRTDMFTFTGDLDGIWAKKNWANVGGRLKMGAYINFSDTEFQRTPVAIRIVGLKEYVNNPYSLQIELSNKVQGHSFATEMRKLQNQEVYFGEMNKKAISETKRSWRDAQETIKQIEGAFPEYTKSIVPATVQTMMALIGNKSTQFDFVVSKTNPIKAPHTLYFDKNTKQINAGSGWLKHFTLGSSDITPNRDANSYKYWNIPAFVSGRLDDKAKTYYLYIKASKTTETGEFILSENKIDIEQEAGFYHFLYATVNSEYEGERGIAKLNGFTEITGGQIKTDKITSGNGEQYIHLFDDYIEIKANLKITDGNKAEIKQLVNPDLLSLENRLKQYSNQQIQGEQQARTQAIATAQTATEAYARTQSELTKAQAIATADGKITEVEQRQIQQLQLKLQEAKTFAQQKVDELNIGGRNLLRKTKEFVVNNEPYGMSYTWSNNAGVITNETFNGNVVRKVNGDWQGVKSNMPDIIGEPVTISFWAKTNGKGNFGNYANKNNNRNHIEDFTKYSNDSVLINDNQWHRYTIFNPKGMCLGEGVSNGFIEFYYVSGDIYYSSIKIEKGNKATDWSPAPEDVWDTMVDLGIIDKNAAAINEAEKANIKYINGIFSKGADYTGETGIVKNTITTGALTVGNTLGGNAGINGAGLDDKSIRFFAGKPYSQKEQAPFRVDDNGELWATNAHISGQVNATSGQIGQFYINTDKNDNKGQLFSGDNNSGGNAINYSGIFLKNLNEQTEIHLSSSPIITQNRRGFLDINYKGENHNTIGSNITVRPRTDNEFQKYSLAQKIDGNIFTIGQRAIFDDGYMGLAESYAIINNIRHTHTYIFTSVASNRHAIYLPNHSQIIQITGKSNVTFEVTIIMAYSVGGSRIVVQGVANGYILDNDGGRAEGGDGYIEMARGDTMRLRFCEGNYYIVSLRR